jgi:hypothetical protein
MMVLLVQELELLVVAFIALMGFDFLHASANAKMVNLATNLAPFVYCLKGR